MRDLLLAGELSARELLSAHLLQIEKLNPELNAIVTLVPERAEELAALADQAFAEERTLGVLHGLPVAHKDLVDTAGVLTTLGSPIYKDRVPESDDLIVERMRNAGAVMIGKTNTPEFGHKGKTDNVPFGSTKNPWNLQYSAGGSSGGTSAALASGMIPLGTGSDGGGSIRIPAALGGLSGLKTSQGRIPIGGKTPPGSGLLTVKGPMANTTQDNALALDATVGPDPTDIFSLESDNLNWSDELINDVPKTAIWSPTMGFSTVDEEVLSECEEAINLLSNAGVEIIE